MSEERAAPPLLLDAMLGRLARWLRLMGYDAAYLADTEDIVVVRVARAEGRLVLTRDRELAARRAIRAGLIQSDRLEEQIEQVARDVGPPGEGGPRCAVCNVPLAPVEPESVRDRVPPYVWRTQRDFSECGRCRRVYWPGTHWAGFRAKLGEGG